MTREATRRAGSVSDRSSLLRSLTLPARRTWFALVIAITTLILVGHGCHGDDVDHEPTARTATDGPR